MGIDFVYEDLVECVWENIVEILDNGIDDDENGYIDDVNGWNFYNFNEDVSDIYGYGIFCVGIIGVNVGNGFGIVGINQYVLLMVLCILSLD